MVYILVKFGNNILNIFNKSNVFVLIADRTKVFYLRFTIFRFFHHSVYGFSLDFVWFDSNSNQYLFFRSSPVWCLHSFSVYLSNKCIYHIILFVQVFDKKKKKSLWTFRSSSSTNSFMLLIFFLELWNIVYNI